MRFSRVLGVVFMALVLLVSFSSAQTGRPRTFSLAVGAGYHMSNLNVEYVKQWLVWDETATFIDVLDKANSVGFGATLGYFVTPNIELFLGGFMTSTSNQGGWFGFEVPSYYYYDDAAYDEYEEARKYSQTDLMFGVKYHIMPVGKIDPYVGAGGIYSMAKIQLVGDFYYYDMYDEYYYHTIEIFDPVYEDVKAAGLGGFVVGGLEVGIASSIHLYAEGAYKFAKKSVVHPFSEWFETVDEISLNLGGLALVGGVKVYF